MLFIKIYYYVFLAFIFLLIGITEGVKWLLNPRLNSAAVRQALNKLHFPLPQSMRPRTEQI